MKRIRSLMFVLTCLVAGCGPCAGSPGTLVGARPDASFVTETGHMFALTASGIELVSLDGRSRKTVFARPAPDRSWHVLDVSSDLKTWALGNADTEIFLGDATTGVVRQVTAPGNRASRARFSPDGTKIAVARHSDFSKPGSKDDDTLYIVETASLTTTTLAPTTDSWPAAIAWSADSKSLWVTMNFSKPSQWITLPDPATGAKERRDSSLAAAPAPLAPPAPLAQQVACGGKSIEADRWEPEVRITTPAAPDAGTVVARLDGRKRGFHDYMPDFSAATWSPGCGYVLFEYDRHIWAVPATGGGPGPVVEGERILFAP